MEGDTTIVVAGTPDAGEPEGDEEEWQSTLLGVVQNGLNSGFANLETKFSQELSTLRQLVSDLLSQNTALTSQITAANQTLMEKVTALTQPPLPLVIVPDHPIPQPEPSASTPSEAVVVEEETPPAETRRKRRTL